MLHPGEPKDCDVAEVLWRTAEADRVKALAALRHAEGIQRICDRLLLQETVVFPASADLWASVAADVHSAVQAGLHCVITIFGAAKSGKSTLARHIVHLLDAADTAVVHEDNSGVGPLTFAEAGPTMVVRHKDTIFHSGVSRAVCFTGPWTPCLAQAYGTHLPHCGVRRLQLMLHQYAAPVGHALMVWNGLLYSVES